ncbi:securin-like [Dendropsophus ebraccatus]|uniref:securin-like n=1 Tax=Dendropsophus ebraccatus TaxID=150705 RepID=UPI0038311D6D
MGQRDTGPGAGTGEASFYGLPDSAVHPKNEPAHSSGGLRNLVNHKMKPMEAAEMHAPASEGELRNPWFLDLQVDTMDILLQLDKENDNLFFHSKLNRGSFTRPSKGLHHKKLNDFNTAILQPIRKVLGNVNSVQNKHSSTKVKQKNNQVHTKSKQMYPEIETCIPYNPLDFETFDVPEEHRLSDRHLTGVALFVCLADAKNFEALTSPILSPMESELINYDAYETFSPVLEDLVIDLPLACDF